MKATDEPITIPVTGLMRRQPDGSYKLVEAEYVTTTAGAVARFLMERFNVPIEEVAGG